MSRTVNVITMIPLSLAAELSKKERIINYNTLPQINKGIMEAVREYMTDNVGYSDLPLACLNANAKSLKMDCQELFHYIPANTRDSVMLKLQMPEDTIVSVLYKHLLDSSADADACGDDEELIGYVKEDFKDLLILGQGDFSPEDEVIEFVPYLDYENCKGYLCFDEDFGTKNIDLPGVERYSLTRLAAFIN